MSRAEPRAIVPPAPRLGAAIRAAAVDLYFNSLRLVSANLAWGLTLLVVLFAMTRSLLVAPLLLVMIPLSTGLMGMTTTLVRHGRLFWSDWTDAVRRSFGTHLGIGVAQLLLVVVAAVDIVVGLQTPGLLGPIITMVGLYSLIAVWVLAVTTWPLLLDPVRAGDGARACLRLGFLLAVAHPLRIGALALLLAALLAVSVVIAAALVTVSGAYAALVAARYVLPAADRLEGRATLEVAD